MSREPNNAQGPAQAILSHRLPLSDADIAAQKPIEGTAAVGVAAQDLATAEAEERKLWQAWWLAKDRVREAQQAWATAINERVKILEQVREVRPF